MKSNDRFYPSRMFATFFLLCVALPSMAQSLQQRYLIPNGPVNKIIQKGTTIYMGGEFSRLGTANPYGLGFSRTSSQPIAGYLRPNGAVRAVVGDGNGGWYIAGEFSMIGTESRAGFAYINAAGTLDPWTFSIGGGGISNFLISGTTLYICGSFTSINGSTRNRLASIDLTTKTLTSWDPNVNGSVSSMAIAAGTLYFVGGFGSVGGTGRSQAAAVNATTGVVTGFNPNVFGNSTKAVATNGTSVYIAGDFQKIGGINGTTRLYIAELNPTTGIQTAWNPGCDNTIWSLLIDGPTLYVGGGFSATAGQGRYCLASFNTNTGALNPLSLPLSDAEAIFSMAKQGDILYMTGLVQYNFDYPNPWTAAVDVSSGSMTSWNPSLAYYTWAYGAGFAIAANNNAVYIGGNFTTTGNIVRNRLAALNAVTGLPTSWDPSVDGPVNDMVINGSSLFFGGKFTAVGTQSRMSLASVDITTGAVSDFDAGGILGGLLDYYGTVYAVEARDGKMYAGGDFNAVGGILRPQYSRLNLVEIDSATANVTTLDLSASQSVRALLIEGGHLYIGGQFQSINSTSPPNLARMDIATGTIETWNPFVMARNGEMGVRSLAARKGILYIAGDLNGVAGVQGSVAAVDISTAQTTSWSPGVMGNVSAVAVDSVNVYIGGWNGFMINQSVVRNGVASIDAATGVVTSWNPALSNTTGQGNPTPDYLVRTISTGPIGALIGGSFTGYDGDELRSALGVSSIYNSVLPVRLGSFAAAAAQVNNNWQVNCDWSTYSEDNTSYFSIERSKDGKIFELVGKVQSAGSSRTLLTYHFVDMAPLDNISYYRIKSVDRDGRTNETDIRKVSLDFSHKIALQLYPNPAAATIKLVVTAAKAGMARVELRSMSGQIVFSTGNMKVAAGSNTVTIPVQKLPAGDYLVSYAEEGLVRTGKITVVR